MIQYDQTMARYNPEVTVPATNNSLQLLVNLTIDIGGTKLIYAVKNSTKKVSNVRIKSTQMKKQIEIRF